MTVTPDPRVDELRQQLKALGYLDAGVDRFVLGPARGRRAPLAIALLASLRIGLLGGLLLGPAAAIGLGGRLPGLITSPRDAAIVALYLAVVFGGAVAAAAFVASTIVNAFSATLASGSGSRARRLAIAAGMLISVACLAYLTLWWRTANAGAGSSSPVWTGFALAVAVAISLLLGHAVTITALAVTMAAPGPHERPSPVPGSSWKVQLAGGAIAFAGAAALLVLTAPRSGAAGEPAPPLPVVSSGARVRVYAIDGLDVALFRTVAAQFGLQLPTLAPLVAGATVRLTGEDWSDPARAWTSVSTGQPPGVHGVHGLETRRVAGLQGAVAAPGSGLGRLLRGATDLVRLTRPAVASGTDRRVKTVWEVAADAGLRTAVVNWWATWPAPAQSGVVLTDRAALRLQVGGELDAEIAPAGLYERLRARWPDLTREAASRAAAIAAAAAPDVRALVRRAAELDATHALLARDVTAADVDLVCTYLSGLDVVQHGLAGTSLPAALALPEYYRFLDALLAELIAADRAELLVVVMGPGRTSAAAQGAMALRGPAVRPATTIDGRTVDVMPTILHALGVPISRELAGRPLTGVFTDAFVGRYPVREVPRYGAPTAATAPREGQPLDREMIDRLRSLGYLK